MCTFPLVILYTTTTTIKTKLKFSTTLVTTSTTIIKCTTFAVLQYYCNWL